MHGLRLASQFTSQAPQHAHSLRSRLTLQISTVGLRFFRGFQSLVSKNWWNIFGSFEFERNKLMIEGSLEVKLPTIWTDEKQRWEESEKRREEERRSKRESLRRKKIQVREKVGKSRNTVFFQ